MTFWFLSEQFQSLSIAGKIAAIAGFILVILLMILWEISTEKRHDAKRLPTVTHYSADELIEKSINTGSSRTTYDDMPKHRKGSVVWHRLLGKCLSNLRKNGVYCYPQ